MSGLRERKKAETRAALSWAAIHLSIERGFENVRVEDIADAVGVSARTFNNYFSSKAEAVVARHGDRTRAIADALRTRPPSEPLWTAIAEAVLAAFAPGPEVSALPPRAHAEWVSGLQVMLAEPALQGEMHRTAALAEAELAEAVAARTGTDPQHDLYPRLVAAVVGAASAAATQHYLRSSPPVSIEALLRESFDRLAAGLPEPA